MDTVACRHVLAGADYRVVRDQAIRMVDGRIQSVEAAHAPGNWLALPALVNAHDHARPLRTSAVGIGNKPLETWLSHLALLPPVNAYLGAAVSLGRSALGGCGTVMVHYTRPIGSDSLPLEAAAVARAANDIGVRVGFAVALKDKHPLVYGDAQPLLNALPASARAEVEARFLKPAPSTAEQLALVDAVADQVADSGMVVQYGPTGPQWCSDGLLTAIAEASARTGRRIHMHCLETRYQRDHADLCYPGGLLPHLDSLGLLSPRLTLAHCTWARPAELELIAERGVTIAVNAASNLGLRSGIAPVVEMHRRGCKVAMGLDGLTFDEDDDALSELRLNHHLHQGWGFERTVTDAQLLAMACRHGREAVLGEASGGVLSPGEVADVLVIDLDALDPEALIPDPDSLMLLFARGRAHHIQRLLVGGREVVVDGQVQGIDHPALSQELWGQFRHGLSSSGPLREALAALEREVGDFYQEGMGCG